jgi:hypothetical protein
MSVSDKIINIDRTLTQMFFDVSDARKLHQAEIDAALPMSWDSLAFLFNEFKIGVKRYYEIAGIKYPVMPEGTLGAVPLVIITAILAGAAVLYGVLKAVIDKYPEYFMAKKAATLMTKENVVQFMDSMLVAAKGKASDTFIEKITTPVLWGLAIYGIFTLFKGQK